MAVKYDSDNSIVRRQVWPELSRPRAGTSWPEWTKVLALGTTVALQATITGVGSVSPAFTVSSALKTIVTGASTVSAALSATNRLAATATGASTVTAAFSKSERLTTTVAGVSTVSASLTRPILSLKVTVAGQATMSPTLTLVGAVVGVPGDVPNLALRFVLYS